MGACVHPFSPCSSLPTSLCPCRTFCPHIHCEPVQLMDLRENWPLFCQIVSLLIYLIKRAQFRRKQQPGKAQSWWRTGQRKHRKNATEPPNGSGCDMNILTEPSFPSICLFQCLNQTESEKIEFPSPCGHSLLLNHLRDACGMSGWDWEPLAQRMQPLPFPMAHFFLLLERETDANQENYTT